MPLLQKLPGNLPMLAKSFQKAVLRSLHLQIIFIEHILHFMITCYAKNG